MKKTLYIASIVLISVCALKAQTSQDFGLTREWATYLGDMYTVEGSAIDGEGNIWITGEVLIGIYFSEFITPDAQQPNYGGGDSDGYLLKLSPEGELLYASFIGGEGIERIHELAIDTNGNIYIGGGTQSNTNISTPGSYHENFDGINNGFIIKYGNNGEKLWGTYFIDEVSDLALAQNDQFYITGGTDSQTGIATPGTFDDSIPGNADIEYYYVVKLDALGYPIWGTYYSPDNEDVDGALPSITVDSQNNVYMAGRTTDLSGYFSTPGAHQESNPSQNNEFSGFIVKFSPEGQRLWGTYYGGEATDWIFSLTIDGNDDLYGAGVSLSQNVGTIGTPGSYLENSSGSFSTFMFKMDPTGQRLWGTYVDTDPMDVPILQNSHMRHLLYIHGNNLYFSYETENDQNIATEGAHQNTLEGFSDGYVLKFDLDGVLLWGTYYGGEDEDSVEFVQAIGDTLYFGGRTSSYTGMATTGIFQENFTENTNSGFETNGFLAKFVPENLGNSTSISQGQWLLWPNPNNGDFYIRSKKTLMGKVQLEIFSITGKLVHQSNFFLKGSDKSFPLHGQFKKGIYFVKLSSKNQTRIFKMLVL